MMSLLKRPRALITLMLLAVVLAGGVQWALSARRASAAPAPAAGPAPAAAAAVVVTGGALPPGHVIQPADLTELPWPADSKPAGAIVAGTPAARALPGSVTRRALAAGEVLLPAAVIRPGERGFLAAVISPGHRAIAIAVEAATAAGGLILPGDHVDVILTQELRDDSVPLGQRVLAETILSDVRILSTDQKLATAAEKPVDPESVTNRITVPATVTLEVTPAEAERVTVGSTLGRLHLTLRAVAAETAADTTPTTWASTVSPALASVRRQAAANTSAAPAPASAPRPAVNRDAVRIFRGSNGEAK